MLRALAICGTLAFASDPALAETCRGPADDGSTVYSVSVVKGSDGKPDRVEVADEAAEAWVSFDSYEDRTPKAPTDERFRFVFHDGTPAAGEVAVLLLEGGFTQKLSAQIWVLANDGEEPLALASLICN